MKVFLVVSEKSDEEGKITEISKYVTCHDDSISSVAGHCEAVCESLEEDLLYVRHAITICEHITP